MRRQAAHRAVGVELRQRQFDSQGRLHGSDELDGVISLLGTASQDSFAYYRIEIRPDAASIFNLYERSEVPVVNGTLAEVNTHLFGDGLHWIRLTLVQPNGEFPTPCAIPVIFR